MVEKVFINLPVIDLGRSIHFFEELDFRFDEKLTDDQAACLILGENIFVMLLLEGYFKKFTSKKTIDARTNIEVIITLDMPSKNAIKRIIATAIELGAHIYTEAEDHGWMYQHSFSDLDGHQWEFIFTDKTLLPDLD